jgi:hypothetical protein
MLLVWTSISFLPVLFRQISVWFTFVLVLIQRFLTHKAWSLVAAVFDLIRSAGNSTLPLLLLVVASWGTCQERAVFARSPRAAVIG